MAKVLIIGSTGQLGTALLSVLKEDEVIPFSHEELEISDFGIVQRVVAKHRPEIVINTSAFHRVDDCEDEVDQAFRINAFAVLNLARLCNQQGSTLVHFSTDYVFNGKRRTPYVEEDLPNPLSVYGVSKLAGECFVQTYCPSHFLIRTSGLYGLAGSRNKGGNFVLTMLKLARDGREIRVVGDQVLTPTYAFDLAHKVGQLIKTKAYGLWHIANSGQCSWFQFASQIFMYCHLRVNLKEITSSEYGARATRPAFSVLASSRLKTLHLDDMPVWEDALKRYLDFLQANVAGAGLVRGDH